MTLKEIKDLVQGEIICGEDNLDQQIECVFASDLMSDVLTLRDVDNLLLLTGLSNLQSIRTCEMSDICYMLVVRGKAVTDEMKELADLVNNQVNRLQEDPHRTEYQRFCTWKNSSG